MNIDDILNQAKPVERSIPLCLRGDLVAQYEKLDRERANLEPGSHDSLTVSPAMAIARQMAALREQMQEATVTFVVRGLPRKRFQALAAEHPPRRGPDGNIHEDDAYNQVNGLTFYDPLIRLCLLEPVMTDEQLTRLLDEVLSDRQWSDLAGLCLVACRGSVDIPFSSAASAVLRSSGDDSNALNALGFPSSDSTDGNLPPATDTTALAD